MIIDLITGLLGAGKTTFIKQYAKHFLDAGQRICILASDYGAISIDRAVLSETFGDRCDVEMITAADPDCYRRRFRTKLIAMGMSGYDRVIVEPSGVFDADEFFDLLYESPLDRWYQVGSLLCIVDAGIMQQKLTPMQEYLLVSEAASAGKIVLSRTEEAAFTEMTVLSRGMEAAGNNSASEQKSQMVPASIASDEKIENLCRTIADYLNQIGTAYHCSRIFCPSQIIASDWFTGISVEDFQKLSRAEFVRADIMKISSEGSFRSLFYYQLQKTTDEMKEIVQKLFSNQEIFGNIIRIKGFFHDPNSKQWFEVNAVREKTEIHPSDAEKECVIVIGMDIRQQEVNLCFGETRSVTDYEV